MSNTPTTDNNQHKNKPPSKRLNIIVGGLLGLALTASVMYYPYVSAIWRIDEVCDSITTAGVNEVDMKKSAAANRLNFTLRSDSDGQSGMIFVDIPGLRVFRNVKVKNGLIVSCDNSP